jgi:hypothetical protein
MSSAILIVTAVESAFGFLLTGTVFYLVLSRGRRGYHYLFAAFLLICMIWDLGTFLMMLRNDHAQELETIGRLAILPCVFLPALIFHFANLYTGQPIKWAVALVWAAIGASWAGILAGVFYRIEGIHAYDWGNIFRVVPGPLDPLVFVFWFAINLPACWLLSRGLAGASSRLERRHYLYLISGLLAVTFAIVKALVTFGIDAPFLLPLGMFLNDIFAVIIGLAIIKDRLFDVTVIVSRGTLYSILAALLIFTYSFSEHVLITYFGKLVGGQTETVHLVSIAVGIAVLMPAKRRLEQAVESYFAQKKVEF